MPASSSSQDNSLKKQLLTSCSLVGVGALASGTLLGLGLASADALFLSGAAIAAAGTGFYLLRTSRVSPFLQKLPILQPARSEQNLLLSRIPFRISSHILLNLRPLLSYRQPPRS